MARMNNTAAAAVVLSYLLLTALLIALAFAPAVYATGNVAGAIQSTWTAARVQIQSVVDNVVFPVLDMILAVLFFCKVGAAYFDYRKHGQFEFAAPAILFACLVFTLLAPQFIWTII